MHSVIAISYPLHIASSWTHKEDFGFLAQVINYQGLILKD